MATAAFEVSKKEKIVKSIGNDSQSGKSKYIYITPYKTSNLKHLTTGSNFFADVNYIDTHTAISCNFVLNMKTSTVKIILPLRDRIGSRLLLSVKQSIIIVKMLKFDGDSD